jgi:hypothetical protein
MFTTAAKSKIACFFNQFVTSALYDSGFGDVVSNVGLRDPMGDAQLGQALAYVSGAAAMARLANTHMSPQWCICEAMERAGGILLAMHNATEAEDSAKLDLILDCWTREIRHELTRAA